MHPVRRAAPVAAPTFAARAVPPAPVRLDLDTPDDDAPRPTPALPGRSPADGASASDEDDPVPTFDDALSADAVAALVARSRRRGSAAAFQALLAAAEETVRGVLAPVREAAETAINLAQQQTVDAAATHLAAGADTLHAGLSTEGLALMPERVGTLRSILRPAPGWIPRLRARAAGLTHPDATPRPTWVAATAAAVDALGGAAEHLATLASAQPPDSSARALGLGVAAQLRAHRDALLGDVVRLVE